MGRIHHGRNDLTRRRQLAHQVQVRHTKRHGGPAVLEFQMVLDERSGEVPVISGELLVRAGDADNQRVRSMVDTGPLAEVARPLDGRLVRLQAPGLRGDALSSLVGELSANGVKASMNYVVPAGDPGDIVWKGLAGPEPSAGPGPVRPERGAGTPVRVAVIDTGIAAERRTDAWLTDVVRDRNIDPLDTLPPIGSLDLAAGHGTFAAGIVQQIAPDADIAVYRTLDSDGIGSEVDVAEAMVRAVREGAQILNLSVGLETVGGQPPMAFQTALELIGEYEVERQTQVLVVAAAGNFGHDRECWPGAFPSVTAVGALTQDGAPAGWSSRGSWVDCSTIGEGVRSTYVKGRESQVVDPDPDTFGPDSWALWTGTSFTAPQIAGAVALVAQREPRFTGPDGAPRVRDVLAELLAGQPDVEGYGRAIEILPPT